MASIKNTMQALSEKYPAIKMGVPLAIGSSKQMSLDGISMEDIQRALRKHTSTQRYLLKSKYSTHRYNLDSTQAEEIHPNHREAARVKLNIRATHRSVRQYMEKSGLTTLPKKRELSVERKVKRLEEKLATLKVI